MSNSRPKRAVSLDVSPAMVIRALAVFLGLCLMVAVFLSFCLYVLVL